MTKTESSFYRGLSIHCKNKKPKTKNPEHKKGDFGIDLRHCNEAGTRGGWVHACGGECTCLPCSSWWSLSLLRNEISQMNLAVDVAESAGCCERDPRRDHDESLMRCFWRTPGQSRVAILPHFDSRADRPVGAVWKNGQWHSLSSSTPYWAIDPVLTSQKNINSQAKPGWSKTYFSLNITLCHIAPSFFVK